MTLKISFNHVHTYAYSPKKLLKYIKFILKYFQIAWTNPGDHMTFTLIWVSSSYDGFSGFICFDKLTVLRHASWMFWKIFFNYIFLMVSCYNESISFVIAMTSLHYVQVNTIPMCQISIGAELSLDTARVSFISIFSCQINEMHGVKTICMFKHIATYNHLFI